MEVYFMDISQPANGTISAPSKRWTRARVIVSNRSWVHSQVKIAREQIQLGKERTELVEKIKNSSFRWYIWVLAEAVGFEKNERR